MHTSLALAPLTLVAVLALSGVAKLGDPSATAEMVRSLRLPRVLRAPLVGRALPVAELVTAALLLTPWRWAYAAGAAGALVLFTSFLLVVARAMTFDPRPTCACFGRVGAHRLGPRTLWRNVLLLALAFVTGWIALRGGTAATLAARSDAADWLWLLLGAASAAVAVLVRVGGEPAPARSPVARGVLLAPDLGVTDLHRLARERAQLLVLVDCWCGTTMAAIDRLPHWRERLPQLDVQLVHTQHPWDEPRLRGVPGVWWDPAAAVLTAAGAGSGPAAVLVATDGLPGAPVSGLTAVERLVDELARQQVGPASTTGR